MSTVLTVATPVHKVSGAVPFDGQVSEVDSVHGLPCADDREHGLAPISHMSVREDRLILQVRINAETVFAWNVPCAQDGLDPIRSCRKCTKIADLEGCPCMGRAIEP